MYCSWQLWQTLAWEAGGSLCQIWSCLAAPGHVGAFFQRLTEAWLPKLLLPSLQGSARRRQCCTTAVRGQGLVRAGACAESSGTTRLFSCREDLGFTDSYMSGEAAVPAFVCSITYSG